MANRYARSSATRTNFTSHLPDARQPRDRHPGSQPVRRPPAEAHARPPCIPPAGDPGTHASNDEAGASPGCGRQPNRPPDSRRTPPQAHCDWTHQAAGARQDASARPWSRGGRLSNSPRDCACDGPQSARTAQADSFSRPLRRRFARMARPARVRMRRRKPCLRARRRLLGWYVRLLTGGSSRRGWSHLRRSLPGLRSASKCAGSKVGERVVDGHRSFTDLRPVNTRQVSRRPTPQRYGRVGSRSNRRSYAVVTAHVQPTRRGGFHCVRITLALVWRRC